MTGGNEAAPAQRKQGRSIARAEAEARAPMGTLGEPLLIRVAYALELRRRTGWLTQFRCALARAQDVLQPVMGRGLELKGQAPWLSGSQTSPLRDLRRNLADTVRPRGAHVVVGLAAVMTDVEASSIQPPDPLTHDEGLASYSRGVVVLRVGQGDLCDTYRLLAHELAHLYGGIHRSGEEYLMDHFGEGVAVDPLNAELFSLHRGRGFGPGLAPLGGENLRAMWRLTSAGLEDPATWVAVGALAAHMGKPRAAVRNYRRALDLDPLYGPAFANLGHAGFQMGQIETAEKHYLRALELGCREGQVHNNLAAIYYQRGDYTKAAESLRRALALGFEVHPQFLQEIRRVTGQDLGPGSP